MIDKTKSSLVFIFEFRREGGWKHNKADKEKKKPQYFTPLCFVEDRHIVWTHWLDIRTDPVTPGLTCHNFSLMRDRNYPRLIASHIPPPSPRLALLLLLLCCWMFLPDWCCVRCGCLGCGLSLAPAPASQWKDHQYPNMHANWIKCACWRDYTFDQNFKWEETP